jgi:DNA-binding MarR family transcriptional regulator
MSSRDSVADEAAHLGPAYQETLRDLRRAGWIRRRRLRGDYVPTEKGWALYRDYNRHHEEALERGEAMLAKLQAGELTPTQGQVRLIELMGLVLQELTSQEREAIADLQAQGFNPVDALGKAGIGDTAPEEDD